MKALSLLSARPFMGNSRGQAIVEFALIFPFLFVLVGGTVDWGLGLLVSHLAQNAAREGARIASTMLNPGKCVCTIPGCYSETPGSVLKETANRIPNVGLFSGFTINNLGVRDPVGNSCIGLNGNAACQCEVELRVTGTYNFSFIRLLGFTDITISRAHKVRWEKVPLC